MVDSELFQKVFGFCSNVVATTISCDGFWNIEVLDHLPQCRNERVASSLTSVDFKPVGEAVHYNSIGISGEVQMIRADMLERVFRDDWVNWWEIPLTWCNIVAG